MVVVNEMEFPKVIRIKCSIAASARSVCASFWLDFVPSDGTGGTSKRESQKPCPKRARKTTNSFELISVSFNLLGSLFDTCIMGLKTEHRPTLLKIS